MTESAVQPFVRGRWWGRLTFAVLMVPLAARLAPWPELATALQYAQRLIILTGIAVYVRHGSRLRRGVWTAQSWRRFLMSVVVSLAAVALLWAFAGGIGIDEGRTWIGERGSTSLRVNFLAALVLGFVGVGMFAGALHRFATDDPTSQYESRLSRLWARVSRGS